MSIINVEKNKFEVILSSVIEEIPGTKISREKFLRTELSKHFDSETVEKAINSTPAQAGISVNDLEHIAKSCINNETVGVTTKSVIAGIPGKFAMLATIPADILQFFVHVLRVAQKLAYLYSWPELFTEQDEGFDDETLNQLTLFVGVMFGVNVANVTLTKVAGLMALRAEKVLPRQALTKGVIYPVVKRIAKSIGVRMNKQLFSSGVSKTIPIVGGVTSGLLTYTGFKPMAKRLQKHLSALSISDVELCQICTSDEPREIIDVDFQDVSIDYVD